MRSSAVSASLRVRQKAGVPARIPARGAVAEVPRPGSIEPEADVMSSNSASLPADATEALEQLGRLTLHEQSMQKLLQAVTDLAKLVMPGDTEASVSLLVDEKPSTAVFTGQMALDLDERQYERGYGPCLHAAVTGEITEIAETETETRWTDYVRAAADRGCRSSLSTPLSVGDR